MLFSLPRIRNARSTQWADGHLTCHFRSSHFTRPWGTIGCPESTHIRTSHSVLAVVLTKLPVFEWLSICLQIWAVDDRKSIAFDTLLLKCRDLSRCSSNWNDGLFSTSSVIPFSVIFVRHLCVCVCADLSCGNQWSLSFVNQISGSCQLLAGIPWLIASRV